MAEKWERITFCREKRKRKKKCLPFVLVQVSLAVIKHHDHKPLGKEGFISSYAAISQPVTEGSQARTHSRRTGADAEAMDKCCSLVCSWRLSQFAFFNARCHQPRDGTAHNQRDRPSHVIITEDNTPQGYYLQDNLVGMIFQGRLPLLK